ncbi:MAG: hypothetical protein QMB63_03200 [Clostridiaceae bacterium]
MSKYERLNKDESGNSGNLDSSLVKQEMPINSQDLLNDETVREKVKEELEREENKESKSIFQLLGKGVKTFGTSLKKAIKDEDLL